MKESYYDGGNLNEVCREIQNIGHQSTDEGSESRKLCMSLLCSEGSPTVGVWLQRATGAKQARMNVEAQLKETCPGVLTLVLSGPLLEEIKKMERNPDLQEKVIVFIP